jgi:O-antigen/teichoic acid export membrane protein
MIQKKYFNNKAICSSAQVISAAVYYLVVVKMLMKVVGLEYVGLNSVLISLTAVSRIVDLGLTQILTVLVSESRASNNKIKIITNLYVNAVFVSPVIFGFITYLMLPFVYDYLSIDVQLKFFEIYFLIYIAIAATAAVCTVFSAVMDGLGEFLVRNNTQTVLNIACMPIAYFFIECYKFEGYLFLTLFYNLILVFLFIAQLRKKIGYFYERKFSIRFIRKNGMFKEGLVSSVMTILYESSIKFIYAKALGLVFVAIYELAFQVVSRARNIFGVGLSYLVSDFANINKKHNDELADKYFSARRGVRRNALLLFAFLILILPITSWVFMGDLNLKYMIIYLLLAIGWCTNAAFTVEYFLLQAKKNTYELMLSHMQITLGTVFALALVSSFYKEEYALLFTQMLILMHASYRLQKHVVF